MLQTTKATLEARSNLSQYSGSISSKFEKFFTSIIGWPSETPFVLGLYWSPTQLAARSHPHQLRLQRELNSWWHDSPTNPTTSADPLSYADAVRIRPPGI